MRHLSTTSFSTSKSTTPGTRSGFTLLELLAVVTIISILVALILPAISGVLGRADEVAVAAEMTQMEQALATFKQEFGRFPPSNITLYGTAAGWNSDPQAKSMIRKMWKDFEFSTGGRLVSGTPQNTDPTAADYHPWGTADITLTGDESLVFFLGGAAVPNGDGVAPTLSGFAMNGRAPFAVAGANRLGPFFEFKGDRLFDEDSGDLAYSYKDGLGTTDIGIYYSSAENGRYAATDACYFQGDGKTPWKKETYQLIAPGEDGAFGNIASSQNAIWTEDTEIDSARLEERDNITNFSGGTLGN